MCDQCRPVCIWTVPRHCYAKSPQGPKPSCEQNHLIVTFPHCHHCTIGDTPSKMVVVQIQCCRIQKAPSDIWTMQVNLFLLFFYRDSWKNVSNNLKKTPAVKFFNKCPTTLGRPTQESSSRWCWTSHWRSQGRWCGGRNSSRSEFALETCSESWPQQTSQKEGPVKRLGSKIWQIS